MEVLGSGTAGDCSAPSVAAGIWVGTRAELTGGDWPMLGGVAWPLEGADDWNCEPCPSGRVRVNRSDGEVFELKRMAGPLPRADAGNTTVEEV